MPVNLLKEDINIGDIVYQWNVKEYEPQERNRRWYIFMGVIAVLLVIFGIWSTNYLFILVVVLFSIIIMLHGVQEPMDVNFAVTQMGVVVGNTYYRYSELSSFWIIYHPPEIKNLYLGFDRMVKHRLLIPLHDYDPRPIRQHLEQFLEEDLEQEEEPFSDRIARLFHLY
jgi:hypothetical protein